MWGLLPAHCFWYDNLNCRINYTLQIIPQHKKKIPSTFNTTGIHVFVLKWRHYNNFCWNQVYTYKNESWRKIRLVSDKEIKGGYFDPPSNNPDYIYLDTTIGRDFNIESPWNESVYEGFIISPDQMSLQSVILYRRIFSRSSMSHLVNIYPRCEEDIMALNGTILEN